VECLVLCEVWQLPVQPFVTSRPVANRKVSRLELNYTVPLGGTGPTDNTEFYEEHRIRNNLMAQNPAFELR
jgi:hypothetical protein